MQQNWKAESFAQSIGVSSMSLKGIGLPVPFPRFSTMTKNPGDYCMESAHFVGGQGGVSISEQGFAFQDSEPNL